MKYILAITFLGGLRITVHSWIGTFREIKSYFKQKKEGFVESDYSGCYCQCDDCKVTKDSIPFHATWEHDLLYRGQVHNDFIKEIARDAFISFCQSIFSTGLILLILYFFINL